MSEKKIIKIVEIVIFVLLLLGAMLMAICFFWRTMVCQVNVAGAAAVGGSEAVQSSQQDAKGAETMVHESGDEIIAVPARAGRASPSFRGRGAGGNPPCVGASHVEDDGPIPPAEGECHRRN